MSNFPFFPLILKINISFDYSALAAFNSHKFYRKMILSPTSPNPSVPQSLEISRVIGPESNIKTVRKIAFLTDH